MKMKNIIEYITRKYHPLSLILYGSYANGTNTTNSDFDALVISSKHERFHDTSVVDGVALDVFVYPATYFEGEYSCDEFLPIADGKILTDIEGRGKALQARVFSYLENLPNKTTEEIRANLDWCVKMVKRAKTADPEGLFRHHWLLIDSLEIFCDTQSHAYLGPKKTLQWMEEAHPEAFAHYASALKDFTTESLVNWIQYLQNTH